MFRYLIASSDSTTSPLIIAFTVHNNTLSGYLRTSHEDTSLPSLHSTFFKCADSSFFDNTRHPFEYIYQNDKDHPRVHSQAKGEIDIEHNHMKYEKTINSDMLRAFLKSLQNCERMQRLNMNTFITQEVIEDIVTEFAEYQTAAAQEGKQNSSWFASNSPHYYWLHRYNLSMPTIPEHNLCLTNSSLGCTPSNILTPPRFLKTYNEFELKATAVVLGLGYIGLRLFGAKTKIAEQRIESLDEKVKQSLNKLT